MKQLINVVFEFYLLTINIPYITYIPKKGMFIPDLWSARQLNHFHFQISVAPAVARFGHNWMVF